MHVMSRHELFLAVMAYNTLFSLTPETRFQTVSLLLQNSLQGKNVQ